MPRTFSAAFPTVALSSFGVKVKVGRFVQMALRTMSFGSLFSSEPHSLPAPLSIHASSDCFDMTRTATGRVPTKVIRFQSLRDWAKFSFVKKPMDTDISALKSNPAIAMTSITHVLPTWAKFWGMGRNRTILIHLSPNIFKGISWRHGDMIPHYDW